MRFVTSLLPILCFPFFFLGCDQPQAEGRVPKIAIAGLAIESSTFSPATTSASAFLARQGDDIFDYYPFLQENSPQRQAAEWVPTLRGHALPGGIVTRQAYDSLVGVTIALLEKNQPYDGLFFE